MSNREVMQQALEALELAKLNGKAGMYPAEIEEIAAAISALRAALAEPQETKENGACASYAQTPSRQGSPQGEQRERAHQAPDLSSIVPATQRQPQEPVAWLTRDAQDGLWHPTAFKKTADDRPLYTHPAPQRQPLTEEQIIALRKSTKATDFSAWSDSIAFARAIERAHGIGGQDDTR